MSETTNNLPVRGATVALTKAMLEAPKSLTEMIQLPELQDRWVAVYEKISGKPDGVMRFEAEKMLFSQLVASNNKLAACDRFTVYAAFVELAISGLSLRDGLTYIIPFGNKAQFMVGWQGRLEQMLEIPNIIHVSPPQVVYDCDIWDFEKGMSTIIHTHKPASQRPEDAKIIHAYMIVHFSHGKEVYDMDRAAIVNIRDNYSMSYKAYLKALKTDKNKDKKYGDTLTGSAKGPNGWFDFDLEPPMWITAEEEAFKKTVVKRAWKSMKKLPKQSMLDDKFEAFAKAHPGAEFTDPDENKNAPTIIDPEQQRKDVEGILTEFEVIDGNDIVDVTSGEVTGKVVDKPEKTTRKTTAKKTEAAPEVSDQAQTMMQDNADQNKPEPPADEIKADDIDTSEGF